MSAKQFGIKSEPGGQNPMNKQYPATSGSSRRCEFTREEISAIISLAGEEAQKWLPSEQRNTRFGICVHEAAHAIVAFRLGRICSKIWISADGREGAVEFGIPANTVPVVTDAENANASAEVALPMSPNAEREIWLSRRRIDAEDLVRENFSRIRALAALLDEKGEIDQRTFFMWDCEQDDLRKWFDSHFEDVKSVQ